MKEQRLEILQKVANGELTPEQAETKLLGLSIVGKSLHPELKPVYDFIESMQELKRIGLLEPFLYENKEQVAKLKAYVL